MNATVQAPPAGNRDIEEAGALRGVDLKPGVRNDDRGRPEGGRAVVDHCDVPTRRSRARPEWSPRQRQAVRAAVPMTARRPDDRRAPRRREDRRAAAVSNTAVRPVSLRSGWAWTPGAGRDAVHGIGDAGKPTVADLGEENVPVISAPHARHLNELQIRRSGHEGDELTVARDRRLRGRGRSRNGQTRLVGRVIVGTHDGGGEGLGDADPPPSSSLSRSTMKTWLGHPSMQSGYSASASPMSDDVNVTASPRLETSGSAAPAVEGDPSGSELISVTARTDQIRQSSTSRSAQSPLHRRPDPQTSPVRRRTTPHRIGTRGVPRCLREPAGQARDE